MRNTLRRPVAHAGLITYLLKFALGGFSNFTISARLSYNFPERIVEAPAIHLADSLSLSPSLSDIIQGIAGSLKRIIH